MPFLVYPKLPWHLCPDSIQSKFECTTIYPLPVSMHPIYSHIHIGTRVQFLPRSTPMPYRGMTNPTTRDSAMRHQAMQNHPNSIMLLQALLCLEPLQFPI